MKRSLGLALVLASLSSGVLAGWQHIGSTDRLDLYVDLSTTRKSGTTVKMWHLVDFKKLQNDGVGESYWSNKSQNEYNCNEESSRVIYYTDHTEKMGDGKVAYIGDRVSNWKPISPESMGEALWKVACGVR